MHILQLFWNHLMKVRDKVLMDEGKEAVVQNRPCTRSYLFRSEEELYRRNCRHLHQIPGYRDQHAEHNTENRDVPVQTPVQTGCGRISQPPIRYGFSWKEGCGKSSFSPESVVCIKLRTNLDLWSKLFTIILCIGLVCTCFVCGINSWCTFS